MTHKIETISKHYLIRAGGWKCNFLALMADWASLWLIFFFSSLVCCVHFPRECVGWMTNNNSEGIPHWETAWRLLNMSACLDLYCLRLPRNKHIKFREECWNYSRYCCFSFRLMEDESLHSLSLPPPPHTHITTTTPCGTGSQIRFAVSANPV